MRRVYYIIDNFLVIVQATGGIGLFLLGMIVMTDGLRTLAGDAMRAGLMRFTSGPLSGAVTGAVSTAILQPSSVTTVAAVGFVGAGLMSFPEAHWESFSVLKSIRLLPAG